ncbi:MAG: L-2-hydroxyglutarate oxidase [Nitrospirae bacterium]|nr:L-2-hydroxyglutarate oxidase [Nitrospirota bacterium]
MSAPNHTHKRRPYNDLGSYDFLICGAGIIGLTIARELVKKGYENIIIIEKEDSIGRHASGRNSGVLHAGIYYTPDSLRAKSCLAGNITMKEYCREKGLSISETGKVIVAKDDNEVATLKELYLRALKNGARVELIDERQLEAIEPNAKTCGIALYSYDTAVVDPKAVLNSLYDELVFSEKVNILLGAKFNGLKSSNTVYTNKGKVSFNIFINTAGAYSDKVAHVFGVGLNYRLIPFKGIYRKLKNNESYNIKGNIYPVPDLRNPFLGVHFTKNINGEIYLGPTAIPAFGRENYGIIEGIDIEAVDILWREAILFLMNSGFRTVSLTEPKKYIHKYFFEDASRLAKSLRSEDIIASEKVGIRPQLVDWNKKQLVMDFVVVKDGNSIHVLNATSPAFTSSMAFAEFVVREYITTVPTLLK